MDYQQLTPDAEVFARVWSRVMPDADAGPIALRRPGEQGPPPRPQPAPPPRPQPAPPRGDEAILQQLLEQMDVGLAGGMELARRDRRTGVLLESLQRSARQLRSAWFLLTGRRWQGGPPQPRIGGDTAALVRRQYMWEIEFSRLCQQAAREVRREDLREIMPEQERASIRRRQMLRRMLG